MENQEALFESTLEELSRCYESLAAFYQLGKALVHSENADDFILRALQDMLRVVPCDISLIYIEKSIDEGLHNSIAAQQYHHDIKLPDNPKIANALRTCSEYIWTERPTDPLIKEYACGIACPIKPDRKPLGLLILGRKNEERYLRANELNTIRTYAELFGIAIAQANNIILREQSQRAISELEIASQIQEQLLPVPKSRKTDSFELFAARKSAREVAGDYVDCLTNSRNETLLIVFDVMGKGVSAALLAGMIRSSLNARLLETGCLKTIIDDLNRSICEQVGNLTLFATCSAALIKDSKKKMSVVNAAHCSPLLFRDNKLLAEIAPSAPPLGLFPDSEYIVEEFELKGNESLIMVTDGIYEWKENEVLWGWDRFKDFAQTNAKLTPEAFWQTLQNKIEERKDSENFDDRTILYWKSLI